MTDDSTFKKQIRARMEQTREKYTVARRMVAVGDPGQPPLALRAFLNPHVDLELTGKPVQLHILNDPSPRKGVKVTSAT